MIKKILVLIIEYKMTKVPFLPYFKINKTILFLI